MSKYLFFIFLGLCLHSPAQAFSEVEVDRRPMCNYGGWMSFFDQKGNCIPPWKSLVREDDGIADYGPTYSRKYSCGANGLFRCNPLVFGPGESGKGHCVKTNDTDPNAATKSCLDIMSFEEQQDHIERLSKDPDSHARYIGVAAETVKYCRTTGQDVEYCNELEGMLSRTTKQLANCTDSTKLYQYLPSLVSPLNQNEINQITNNLVPGFQAYLEDLKKRQEEAIAHNEKVYEEATKAYTESSQTQTMIKTLLRNTSKCLESSCLTKEGKRKRGVYYNKDAKKLMKPKWKSVGYCYRYVKYGMAGKGNFTKNKWDISGTYAVHAGRSLERNGFTNVIDDPAFKGITPETAPVGAIIVYRKRGVKSGRPGHIEVKTGPSEYTSDFTNSEPTTVGGNRVPIGIYMKIPKDLEEKLMEVPSE